LKAIFNAAVLGWQAARFLPALKRLLRRVKRCCHCGAFCVYSTCSETRLVLKQVMRFLAPRVAKHAVFTESYSETKVAVAKLQFCDSNFLKNARFVRL
jgi:hypothetical protein